MTTLFAASDTARTTGGVGVVITIMLWAGLAVGCVLVLAAGVLKITGAHRRSARLQRVADGGCVGLALVAMCGGLKLAIILHLPPITPNL